MQLPTLGLEEENEERCCLEATVPTGFESIAKEECNEVFAGTSAVTSRGRIFFDVPVSVAPKALEMKSVDNIYVVVYNEKQMSFTGRSKEDSLNFISSTLNSKPNSWVKALKVWKKVTSGLSASTEVDQNNNIRFRVTCRRSCGKHSFGSPDAAVRYGSCVQDRFGWKPDMTRFDLEVVLNVICDEIYVTLGLTRSSLHKRNISCFGVTTLRSTIANNMLRMARIQDGDVVCDPMCGSGAIPIEGGLRWNRALHLCGDIHPVATKKTIQNIKEIESLSNVDVFSWDVTNLPLKNNSVDVFVTDLPFGKRSGSKTDNRILYPNAILEMARVCRPKSGRAVLLTHDRRSMIRTSQSVSRYWKVSQTLTTNIGGLVAGVYLLRRTENTFKTDLEK